MKACVSIAEARRKPGKYFEFYDQRRRHRGVDGKTSDEAILGYGAVGSMKWTSFITYKPFNLSRQTRPSL